MKVTSPYLSDEVTPRYGVCKNLLFPQISGNFGACANSVHQALLSPPPRAWVRGYDMTREGARSLRSLVIIEILRTEACLHYAAVLDNLFLQKHCLQSTMQAASTTDPQKQQN